MKLGVIGLVFVLISVALIAVAWLYYDLSLWLLIPGIAIFLIGAPLVGAFKEQVIHAGSAGRDAD